MRATRIPAVVVLAAAAAISPACRTPATQARVVLDTDSPPERLLTVRVSASRGALVSQDAEVHTIVRGGTRGVSLPATFGISPGPGGDRSGTVTLQVDATLAGMGTEPETRFRRTVRFHFVPATSIDVRVFLPVACGLRDTGCATVPPDECTTSIRCEEQGLACAGGHGCVSTVIEPVPTDGGLPRPGCPGVPLRLNPWEEVVRADTTSGRPAEFSGSCGGDGASEMLYAVTPQASGTLRLRFDTHRFDGVVYVRRACAAASEGMLCANARGGGGEEVAGFAVTAGTTYYVFADGVAGADGPFALYAQLRTACGDRALDAGEGCDDGNTQAGDGCDASCQPEAGVVAEMCTPSSPAVRLSGGQRLFAGTTVGARADHQCRGATTGLAAGDLVYSVVAGSSGTLQARVTERQGFNGVLYARAGCEATDDLRCVGGDGAGGTETVSFGVTAGNRYEVFVDGFEGSAGDYTLRLALCGDGVTDANEECDDGDTASGDGCSSECRVDGACRIEGAGPNEWTGPQRAPSCAESVIEGALSPAGDEDFFRLHLAAGQILEARTWVGNPESCPSGNDTALELYEGPLTERPANPRCEGSRALLCADDMPGSICSSFVYVAPVEGDYVIRAWEFGDDSSVTSYRLRLSVR